jgi:hypothetical protein
MAGIGCPLDVLLPPALHHETVVFHDDSDSIHLRGVTWKGDG